MSEITDHMSGYINELDNYMDRLNNDRLSRRDRQLFLEMSNAYYDIFSNAEVAENEKNLFQAFLQEMVNFNDNIINQAADSKDQANQYYENIVKYGDSYAGTVKITELMFGVFGIDAEILRLQNEKQQMLQELVDREMDLYGEISQVTQEILEVQHSKVSNGKVEEIREWEQQEDVENSIEKENQVQKVELKIPYMTRNTFMDVKEEIKLMGARYDPDNRRWYVDASAGQDTIDRINDYLTQYKAIYLKLPPASPQRFKQITEQIKSNGAHYDPTKKAWYITKRADINKFADYLPPAKNSVHEKLNQYKNSTKGQNIDNRALESHRIESPELV